MENAEIDALIAYIHQYIDEPLPLSRLASYVAYSPYHFTRLFKERMGLPPLYYVSSLRLQKAKDLLIHTNMSVRDIGLEIGQQSLGTFSSRFTEKVGVSPTEFRNSVQATHTNLHALRSLGEWQLEHPVSPGRGRVVGTVHSDYPFEGVILIGLLQNLYRRDSLCMGRFCLHWGISVLQESNPVRIISWQHLFFGRCRLQKFYFPTQRCVRASKSRLWSLQEPSSLIEMHGCIHRHQTIPHPDFSSLAGK